MVAGGGAERVHVMVRLRPPNETEKAQGGNTGVVHCHGGDAVTISGERERTHTYDCAFANDAPQPDVFSKIGETTINNVLKGYNGTVLAYGQTGSGKTHTMLGPAGGNTAALDPASPLYVERGLIPRLCEALFEKLDALDTAEVTSTVDVSIFELYKEQIFDSLAEHPRDPTEYRIREDVASGRGVYVENLFAKRCSSASAVLQAVQASAGRRKVAATSANETSSRSHSITLLSVAQRNHLMGDSVTSSRLTLVDLAGSEKVGKTQAEGLRLEEAKAINLSLTLLGNVIYKLTDGKTAYIPYRDSKLTRLLQDSLGGNSCTTLLCCASPAAYNKEETISTLAFASRAKRITNKPRVNRDLSAAELKTALANALDEVAGLKERLALQTEFAKRYAASGSGAGLLGSRTSSPTKAGVAAAAAEKEVDDAAAIAERAELENTLARLLEELADVKQQLVVMTEERDKATRQADFHRQRASDLEEELAAANARLKREHATYERKLTELAAESQLVNAKKSTDGEPQLMELSDATGATLAPATASLTDLPQQHVEGGSTARRSGAPAVPGAAAGGRGLSRQALGQDAAIPTSTPVGSRQSSFSGLPPGSAATARRPSAKVASAGRVAQPEQVRRTSGGTRHVAGRGGAGPSGRGNGTRNGGTASPSSASSGGVEGLSVAGFNAANPPPAPMETLAATDDGNGGGGAAAAELRLEHLAAELKRALADAAEAKAREAAANTHRETAVSQCERLSDANDALRREMDGIRAQLATSELNASNMKRILDALNIDVEEQLALERMKTANMSAEALALRGQKDELLEAQGQQEFLDLATAELLFKTQDIDDVENDVLTLQFLDPSEVSAQETRETCQRILRQLDTFVEHVLSRLQNRRFATANLESQRLNVTSDAMDLQSRVAVATSKIGQSPGF